MAEIRFEAKDNTLAVIDGYCAASGKCRTAVINAVLEAWAGERLHEATMICRVAGVNPMESEPSRKAGAA